MRYKILRALDAAEFRRLTGVKRSTFSKMIEVLKVAEAERRKHGGKSHRLPIEDRLLMALEYLREYRTYFHVANSYGMSESACYRSVKWIEDTLIKHTAFALPGKKALLKSDAQYETILVDASESPVERPKKDKDTSILERKNATLSKARL